MTYPSLSFSISGHTAFYTQLQSCLDKVNDEWKSVAEARRALEEAEARAKEVEESSLDIREKQKQLRVKSAEAWIKNWKAQSKLEEGTLKIKKED